MTGLVQVWSADLRQVPHVKLEIIRDYLLAAHDIATGVTGDFETYNSVTFKCYKALRSYDLWESEHISGITFNPLTSVDNYCALKCVTNPSGDTIGTRYQVIVVLKETGEPIGGSCTSGDLRCRIGRRGALQDWEKHAPTLPVFSL